MQKNKCVEKNEKFYVEKYQKFHVEKNQCKKTIFPLSK